MALLLESRLDRRDATGVQRQTKGTEALERLLLAAEGNVDPRFAMLPDVVTFECLPVDFDEFELRLHARG
jgi:hypothetical protein